MELSDDESRRFDDRSTSDLVVRIRTQGGRDDWIYCHSHTLAKKSKYFADRLSDTWPTCQILDSRNCVEVCCEEIDFDNYIAILRLMYSPSELGINDLGSVKNALGILRVSVELGCTEIISSCVDYIEAAPWEESEEEEILKVIPSMGSGMERILARLQPVDPVSVHRLFLSAIRFATSSPLATMDDLKTSAQEQLEYMLTEDDDAPLLMVDEEVKSEAKRCISTLFSRFVILVETATADADRSTWEGTSELFNSYLSDLSWAYQILTKLECSKEFISSWVEISPNMVKLADQTASTDCSSTRMELKILELSAKVLEAIGGGNAVLPTITRLRMVELWLPFSRSVKRAVDSSPSDEENELLVKSDGEFWQSLESSFISIILTLPSTNQAEILREWLESEDAKYPDLGEAFEVWCYRSKVARRRLGLVDERNPSPEEAS